MKPGKTAEWLIKRYEGLRSERSGIFDPVYQQISQYFFPEKSTINMDKSEGIAGWTDELYDTTAIESKDAFASGMRNYLNPSNVNWHAYDPPEYLKNDDEAAVWYGKCTDIHLRLLARSNFYSVKHELDQSLATFGTGLFFCDEARQDSLYSAPFYFGEYLAGTYVLVENDMRVVDTVFREFELTARQAVQKFGLENVSAKVRKNYESASPGGQDKKAKYLHCVYPRMEDEMTRGRLDPQNKPFASYYVCIDDKCIVKESGFDEMPYFAPRFTRWGKSPYGFSPAFLSLPNVRQVNFMTYFSDALAELKVNPRVIIPSSLVGSVDYRAGGETVVKANDPNQWPKEWMTAGDSKEAMVSIEKKQEAIKRAFYVQLFNTLGQLTSQQFNPVQVQAIMSEKIEQFAPVFDRMTAELFNPLLHRTFNLCNRLGYFPTPPASVMRLVRNKTVVTAPPEVTYSSRIAFALKAIQSQAFINALQVGAQIAQGRPDVMDNVDLDQGYRTFMLETGVQPDLLIPEKKRDEMRQQRQEQLQQQRGLDAAGTLSKAAGQLGKAPAGIQKAVTDSLGT